MTSQNCRGAGPWAKCKLSIVREYIPGFINASRTAVHRYYVDLFAGPGCNVVRDTKEIIDGSPVVAINSEVSMSSQVAFKFQDQPPLHYRFNDYDDAAFDQLREIVRHRFPERLGYVKFFNQDANLVVDNILKGIPEQAPAFYVLDPEGSELHWSTVQKIAQRPKADMLINFTLGFMKRVMPKPDQQRVTQVFGTDEWITIFEKSKRRYNGKINDRELLDLYLTRLKGLGMQTVNSHFTERPVKNSRNVVMYYLIFVAKNQTAINIASSIFKRDCSGRTSLF
jgi:three-Cys-motif partner protein